MYFGLLLEKLKELANDIWSLSVKVGDLVRIPRASIGVPAGTIGLIMKVRPPSSKAFPVHGSYHYFVQHCNGQLRRYLVQDLRKIK
jgi:hypothetical protein